MPAWGAEAERVRDKETLEKNYKKHERLKAESNRMNLFSADLSDISIADIEEFLAVKAPLEQRPAEGIRIDYKKKESSDFPETVAAFANTYGGLLFIGVESDKTKNNVPVSIPGDVFVGGDIKARITGKILSQITPRPEISVGVAAVTPQNDRFVVVIRINTGTWPPYQFTSGDKVRIPIRIQDTNRQATLRDVELLFEKRAALSKDPEQRPSAINESISLIPTHDGKHQVSAYQTWIIRPQVPLRLRLDRTFDGVVRSEVQRYFEDSTLGIFYPSVVTGDAHILRWQAGISNTQYGTLKCVRTFEFTSEGDIRYTENIDRHDARQESIADLFIQSLSFLEFARTFYHTRDYWGGLSVTQRVDCADDVQLFATFPDDNGNYFTTAAIAFSGQEHGVAEGSSRVLRKVYSLEKDEMEDLVIEFMLIHLRQLCGASVDYENLKVVVRHLPKRPFYWFLGASVSWPS